MLEKPVVQLFDISLPVEPGMLQWPTGRAAAEHDVVDAGGAGEARNSDWRLDSHAGTHVDAPLHRLPSTASVDRVPLEACFGPCTVVPIAGEGPVAADALPAEALRPRHRVLLKTANSRARIAARAFDADFVALGEAAAGRLAQAGVALVGIDYLSVERPSGSGAVHERLLEAGVVLLEGIDLSAVEPGDYCVSALPLRLVGGEASPVRAILWR